MDVSVRISLLMVLFLVGGCARTEEDHLRDAAERLRVAAAERDYMVCWSLLDRDSRDSFSYQLAAFLKLKESDPLYGTTWEVLKKQYGLDRAQLQQMDELQYFLALFEGSDRIKARLRDAQVAEALGATIVDVKVEGLKAEVWVRRPSGEVHIDRWVKEGQAWKISSSAGSVFGVGS